jgi:hypothetical protein
MLGRSLDASLILVASFGAGAALVHGCSATDGTGLSTASGSGGAPATTSSGVGGIDIILPDGGEDAEDDVTTNPCGSKCGPNELCDTDHLGLDDDCDGQVDEGCGCAAGQVHFCFKGGG